MTIDSHVQFWKYNKKDSWITKDMKLLQQDYLPSHISLTLKRNDVSGVVAVQSEQSEVETLFLTELQKTNPFIKGIVGWVDFTNENIENRLEYFSQYSAIKGWRINSVIQKDNFLLNKDFTRGIKALSNYNYTFDLLVQHQQLKEATELVNTFPQQKFVIDHCGNPDIEGKNINEWNAAIKEISRHQNVYCKLSGLFTQAAWKQWSASDFYPYLDVVFEAFGFKRLMFGSNWPVMLLSGIYVQWKSLLEKYMENFSSDNQAKIFGLNAIEFYNL